MSSRWDEVKRIPIDEVAQRLGVPLSRRAGMRCPFPDHKDKNPSFSIDRKKNLCFCHGCGRGGSVIDFASIITGKSSSEVVSWLSQSIRQSKTSSHQYSRIAPAEEPETEDAQCVANPAIFDHFASLCPPAERGQQYLLNRGISEHTQKSFRIGFIGNSDDVLKRLLSKYGTAALVSCGLIFPDKAPELVFPSRSLLVPFVTGGEIVYFQSRSISNSTRRWMGLNGVRKLIFNQDAVSQAKNIYICEGVTDTLSATEMGLTAIGLTGASTTFSTNLLRSMRSKTAYIIPDNDEAGKAMEARVTALFRRAGIQFVVQRVPHGKDLNDYLVWRKQK
ncbi:toprim domain-containing protein [Bradyrhizobium sp. Gha]|uniref:toprim domain-containing protein n=1 Tax=Bradyrhizobium sp. Gha TaxID=1855318 RepID=UPI000B84C2DD|nr:toprim domain-containing protein [Bradyrhizobium sp. Gha]